MADCKLGHYELGDCKMGNCKLNDCKLSDCKKHHKLSECNLKFKSV